MSVLDAARFYYFHMHHYTGVPEDPDRFVSTWVDYPNRLFDPAEGHTLYQHHLRRTRLAEEVGFDGVALNEHHNTMFSMTPAVSVATWTICARGIPGAGTHAGRDSIINEFLGPVRGTFEPGDPKLDVGHIVAEGSWVAVEAKGRGRYRNGNPYDQDYCYLIEVDGGRIRALRQYFDSHYVAGQMGVGV